MLTLFSTSYLAYRQFTLCCNTTNIMNDNHEFSLQYMNGVICFTWWYPSPYSYMTDPYQDALSREVYSFMASVLLVLYLYTYPSNILACWPGAKMPNTTRLLDKEELSREIYEDIFYTLNYIKILEWKTRWKSNRGYLLRQSIYNLSMKPVGKIGLCFKLVPRW